MDYEVGLGNIVRAIHPTADIVFGSGYDAPFHLSEECSNANVASPRAIVLTSGVGGLFGWFLQIVVAYTVIDIDEVLDSDLGQPWAAYLLQVMPQKAALAILSMTIIAAFSMGQGCMVSSLLFALLQDLAKVMPRLQHPGSPLHTPGTIAFPPHSGSNLSTSELEPQSTRFGSMSSLAFS